MLGKLKNAKEWSLFTHTQKSTQTDWRLEHKPEIIKLPEEHKGVGNDFSFSLTESRDNKAKNTQERLYQTKNRF